MEFGLACGHKVTVMPWDNWLSVIHRAPGNGCMRCYLEAKAEKADDFFGDGSHMTTEVVPALNDKEDER